MKKLILSICLLTSFYFLTPASSFAQKEITERLTKCVEGDQNALTIEINGTVDDIEDALKLKLKAEGLKPSSKKGFITCMETNWSRISKGTMDYYFKVNKVDKEKSSVSFFISMGNNNFVSSENNKSEINNAKDFLQGFVVDVRKYQLTNALEAQVKKIKEAQSDLEKMQKAQKSMEDDKAELEKKITKNKDDQAAKAKEMENLNNQMHELKGKLDELK